MDKKRKNKPGAGRPVTDWPPERVKLLKKLYPTTDNETVAAKLGVTVSAVRNAATRFGITKNGWTEKDEQWLLANAAKMTYDQLAKELGKTRWGVINKYRELTKK